LLLLWLLWTFAAVATLAAAASCLAALDAVGILLLLLLLHEALPLLPWGRLLLSAWNLCFKLAVLDVQQLGLNQTHALEK